MSFKVAAATLQICDSLKIPCMLLLALGFSIATWCGPPQSPLDRRAARPAKEIIAYGGKWWASADQNERSAFITGVDDCLSADAGLGGFWGTAASIDDSIDEYYKTHPQDGTVSVMEVWGKVGPSVRVPNPLEGGERYRNPH